MIPARELAHMIAERGATDETRARACFEAVLLRQAIERIDDNLLRIETHSSTFDDDGHGLLAELASNVRGRIRREIGEVDLALVERLTS